MEFNHSETRLNLARSFAGESQARQRYTIYARVARQENYQWIARIFEETAANEAAHAQEFLEVIRDQGGCAENLEFQAGYPFQLGSTVENLGFAAHGEEQEHRDVYPAFAELARREGFQKIALLWMQIARIEANHRDRFRSLQKQMQQGCLTKKDVPQIWQCLNCGYPYESVNACDPCPVCGKSAGWQAGTLDGRSAHPNEN